MGKRLGFGRWFKSIKNQSTIGGVIIANAYGDTKEEAETIAKLMVEAPETKAKLKRSEAQRDELLKALNLSQQWIIKMNNCLPKSELKDILSAGIKSNEKAIKSITKSND